MMTRATIATIAASVLAASAGIAMLSPAPPPSPPRSDGVPSDVPAGPTHAEPGVTCKHLRWVAPDGHVATGDFVKLVRSIEAALGLKLMAEASDDAVDGAVISAYGGAVVWVCIYTSEVGPTTERLTTLRAAPRARRDAATDQTLAVVCDAKTARRR